MSSTSDIGTPEEIAKIKRIIKSVGGKVVRIYDNEKEKEVKKDKATR